MKRGKGLGRRTPLKATTGLKTSKPLGRSSSPSRSKGLDGGGKALERKTVNKARQRDTGPKAAVRRAVRERDLDSCVVCGVIVTGQVSSIHHRRNRGMGGSSDPRINDVTNLLVVCGTGTTGCHGAITVRPWEFDAEVNGWVVSTNGVVDPARVPVLVAWLGWCYPTAAGEWQVIEDIGEVSP